MQLETLSFIAAHIQRPYLAVRRAADHLGLEPALRINRTDHYTAEQAERITVYLTSAPSGSARTAETGQVPIRPPPAS